MGILDLMPNTKALIEAAKNQPSLEERIEALEQVILEQILLEEVEEDV